MNKVPVERSWWDISLFSFETVTAAQLEQSYLIDFQDTLILVPKSNWLGRIVKCLTSSHLSHIRNCVEKAKETVCTNRFGKIARINSMIAVFNRAIQKHNFRETHSPKWIMPLRLLPYL